MEELTETKFPSEYLVPKNETNAYSFIQKYPDYKGDNVVIAIFDSGVDPKAAGLQETLNGETKVIERYDCSGCGDTDTSTVIIAEDDDTILGLSGRKLKISEFMRANNVNGKEYRIGIKSVKDLYTSQSYEKSISRMKVKEWDEHHKTATADIHRDINLFESKNTDLQNIIFSEKLKKEDYDASLDFLNSMEKKYNDIKISYDIVLFKTDKCWYAVIDTTENGDLQNGILLGEYSKTHDVGSLNNSLSISINVYDNGHVTEIVGMCSSHGTHVASIASGNHKCKFLDGVAPNAKIVSIIIGDGRLGSMETGTALVRGIIKVMELCKSGIKIDIVNMSYGEHSNWSNTGRLGELINEAVNTYGVVWVAAAGNHGPALCTISTPPDISQPSCIGVGAYVSPQMMEAEYILKEKLPGNLYTWTSRDPCIDGGQGVSVCAPGAAITSVPEYTMTRAMLMNGTSMASPHVAGSIALLIAGLKKMNIKYSPFSIKRAICHTATYLKNVDPFAQGNGLLNVEKAFEHLLQFRNEKENLIRFSVSVGPQKAKGIHLRQGYLKKPIEYGVTITPHYLNDIETETKDKIDFNIRLILTRSEPWVQCGEFLDLCYSPRSLVVKVDPTNLPPGVHTAKIRAIDSNGVEKGSIFEIPITVIQPHVIDVQKNRCFTLNHSVHFKPNTIERYFILVPNRATWAVLTMICDDEQNKQISKFFVHTLQILPMKYCKALETMKILSVNKEVETVHAFKCEQNNILELCIAKYWSNFGETNLKINLEFHGITLNGANIMHAGAGIHRIELSPFPWPEEILPCISLKTATVVLKPSESKISPLSSTRDIIPLGRQIYQNILTYNLHVCKTSEISLYAPAFFSNLYESEFESQLWMLFDSNKMMVVTGDAYSNLRNIKLDKGDYVIKLQVRHEKKEYLDKISEVTMLAVYKLQNTINLDIYDQYNLAILSGKKLTSCILNDGIVKSIFIQTLSNEKLTKANLPSHTVSLCGTIIFTKDDIGRKCDINSFTYILLDNTSNKKNNSSTKNNDNKNKTEEYKEGVRDYQCSMISKLDFDFAETVYKEVIAVHPKYLPVHLSLIQSIEAIDNKCNLPFSFKKQISSEEDKLNLSKIKENLVKIIQLADIVINEVDKTALLGYYGLKADIRAEATQIKTNMDKQKSSLLEAYSKKIFAYCKLKMVENEKFENEILEEINSVFTEILKFIDPLDLKIIYLSLWHAYANGHYGRMIKYLLKIYDDKLSKEVYEEIIYVVQEKKWYHICQWMRRQAISLNPGAYRPF